MINAAQQRVGPPHLVVIGPDMLDPRRAYSTVHPCPYGLCAAPAGRPCINSMLNIADQRLLYAVHATRPTVPVAFHVADRDVDSVAHLDTEAQNRAIEHRRLHESHPCVRPGCTNRARVTMITGDVGRFASRDWLAGDLVDLCPDDAAAVAAADLAITRDDLPDWLAIDAKPTNHELWESLLNAPTAEAAQAIAAELKRRGSQVSL